MRITMMGALILMGGFWVLIIIVGKAVGTEQGKTYKANETGKSDEQPNPPA